MKKIGKLFIITSLMAFLMIGMFLLIGHAGLAVRISFYAFLILCFGIVLSYINNDQK